ncbi:hypothetical protein GCM10025868_30620 [Angustibacter aerolatus]|uniref:Uncharacterized protein n=1 Tax=Angustibacter aerolatus TaxID=1162965 RepID=A0ABQ6JLT9_9ACTN|nr:hypothetical protein GCM10025868_30620 [Angustibacter aerolatus]
MVDADRRVAQALAFVRRRLSGDYEVDEFGFDAEPTQVLLPLLRPLYRSLVPRRGARHRERPDRGRRAAGRQPLGHPGARLPDDAGSPCTTRRPATGT